MGVTRREIADGFVLEHARGRLEIHELAPGVIFQDYYGVVVGDYFEPVVKLAKQRLAGGTRLTFFSNASRVNSSPTAYRREWSTWFKTHADRIDDVVVLVGSAFSVLAVKTAAVFTGGIIRPMSDLEAFQVEVERVVTRAWAAVDAANPSTPSAPTPPGSDSGGRTDPFADVQSRPAAFNSPLERVLCLQALNEVLFHESEDEEPSAVAIGRFAVRRHLGSGGMGAVYACFDEVLGREVAVKVLHAGRSKTSRRRILREAKAMARLTHQNVVGVHEIGEEDGTAFLVMELVEGVTVRQWLASKTRSEAEITEIFVSAGRGLAAAHDRGLVHRDFKPENVMVDTGGRVLVMDFGLARDHEFERPVVQSGNPAESPVDLTASGMLVGTPAYMAPETFSGAQTTPRTDQFSFCVAMWEALYGQRPFLAGDLAGLARAVLEDGPIVPRGSAVRRRTREALERGLLPDPDTRWPSMHALLDALTRRSLLDRWF